MELSGLIFVALALVWAVVLLPKALRQHDEVARTRSVEGVSESVRVLARREVVSEREARLVLSAPTVPPTGQAPRQAPDQATRPGAMPAPRLAPSPAPRLAPSASETESLPSRSPGPSDRLGARIAAQRRVAAAAARRRRRILVVLVLAVVAVGAAAGLGRLPVWAVGVPILSMLGFLVLARILVCREHARWDAELKRVKALASSSPAVGDDVAVGGAGAAQPITVAQEAQRTEAASQPRPAVVSGLDDTSSLPLDRLDDVTPTPAPGSLWDPLPVTLPTYVSKPRAARSVRTIDLQAHGVSSSGHDAAASALVADAATSTPPDDLPQQAVGS